MDERHTVLRPAGGNRRGHAGARRGSRGRVQRTRALPSAITSAVCWASRNTPSPTVPGSAKVDPEVAPLPVWLGALGMPGMTAYFGLLDIGQPKAGETVVVSGAAGAVGQIVGQIAKIKGCRAVGIAGGPDEVSLCRAGAGLRRRDRLQERGRRRRPARALPEGHRHLLRQRRRRHPGRRAGRAGPPRPGRSSAGRSRNTTTPARWPVRRTTSPC